MLESFSVLTPELRLFDGEKGGADGGSPRAATPTSPAVAPEAEAPEAEAPESPEARRARWRALVGGEFKDLYAEDAQRMIDRRFKGAKEAEARASRLEELCGRLARRCGLAPGDADGLAAALDAEDAELRRGDAAARATLAQWTAEEAALREKVPGFSLAEETQSPEFRALLRAGMPVERAFRAVHLDEFAESAVRRAAARTEKRVADSVRARGQRPREAGLGAQSGGRAGDEVSSLTRAERAALAKRALRGERITF